MLKHRLITHLVTHPETFIMPNGIFTAISHVRFKLNICAPCTAMVLGDDTRLALARASKNDDGKSLASTVVAK